MRSPTRSLEVAAVLAVVSLLAGGCSGPRVQVAPSPTEGIAVVASPTPPDEPLELRLAKSQDPTVTSYDHPLVGQFRSGLAAMVDKCELTPTEVAVLVLNARLVLDREGVPRNVTLLDILTVWGESITG